MSTLLLDTVDSTNSEAKRRLQELESGTVLAAREQIAGRGQRGNTWFSEPGKNLTFSIIQKFGPGELRAADAHWLNYVISEAVAIFLSSDGISCKIKWPNDIYVGKKKICGILIENVLEGDCVKAAVIGVGLNINQREFPQLALATSLWRCIGVERELEECLREVIGLYEKNLPCLGSPGGRESLFRSYSGHLFLKDVNARYQDYLRDTEFLGVIKGVEPDGRLHILDLDSHTDRYYGFKEVGYIL